MIRIALLVIALSACVENPLVICDNGLACPVGLVCDTAHDACVQPAQIEACAGQADGARCSYAGVASGTCAGGVCFPAVCGGGFVDADEECDDGNRVSGDGCSAECLKETCGNGRLDVGEACDDGDLRNHDGCDSSCIVERPDWQQLVTVPLGYRFLPGVAHDAIRERTVVFGGAAAGSLASDTWEWFDATWSSLSTLGGPSKRLAVGFGFDADRRELVLFGGLVNGTQLVNDTWVFDGHRWQQRMTTTAPTVRNRPALAYDAHRHRMVLFGGYNAGSLGDTWEWDGASWTQRTPATQPSARTGTAFAYNPTTGTTMMVGGLDDRTIVPNDTWTWDGTDWTELHPATMPTGIPVTMAFDVATARMVLLTNTGGTTAYWAWDGSDWAADPSRNPAPLEDGSVMFYDHGRGRLALLALKAPGLTMYELRANGWQAVAPPPVPPARDATAMAYDAETGEVMLFGGRDGSGALLGDLWAWTGARWEEHVASGPAPTPRSAHAMVYDAAHGELLVVGGRTAAGRTGETWAWNGRSWRLAGTLPPHEQFALAYDAAHGRVIAFGGIALGFDGFDHHVAETWAWDGSTWTEIALGSGPPARSGHAMAYDAHRKRVVMFGGLDDYQSFDDLWELDGATWQQRPTALVPARRSTHAMVYDASRGTTVLVGGKSAANDGSVPLGDTWEWDGTNWTPIATFATPSRHAGRAAAYQPATGRVVVFGGGTDETWFYGYGNGGASEVCGGGHDVDRDGLIGCDDPDCWWACTNTCPPLTSCDVGGARCGDGTCGALEDCRLCPQDCGACSAQCGDLLCDPGETGCAGDCP